jgi:hypothetical protein
MQSRRRTVIKPQWPDLQRSVMHKEFGRHIRALSELPGTDDCEAVLTAHPELFAGRSWKNLKDFVHSAHQKYFRPNNGQK